MRSLSVLSEHKLCETVKFFLSLDLPDFQSCDLVNEILRAVGGIACLAESIDDLLYHSLVFVPV